jgi:hypothetical protein
MTENPFKDLPRPTAGMMNLWIGPKEIWNARFPIRFSPMNALVRKHFSLLPLTDVKCVSMEETAGFIRYRISINEVADIGIVCLQEMPEGQSTALSIIAPIWNDHEWTQQERMIRKSQPDRDSMKKVMYELASAKHTKRNELLKWQSLVFNVFLQHLLSDQLIEEVGFNLELYVDDIDSFSQVKNVSPQSVKSDLPLNLYEDFIQTALEEIIGESFHQIDGPDETSDLRTSHLEIRGRRVRAAFMLKGKGTKGKLTIKKCGKNGDQIVKLMDTPAELYVIQHIDDIDERVISDLRSKIDLKNHQGTKCQMCIINGADTARILKAYHKINAAETKPCS